jgi:hypothetical protein
VSYEDFQATFMKENKKLRIMMGVSTLVFVAILILMIFEKKYFVYQGHPVFEERILSESVCLEGFKSITEGEPDSSTVSSGIIGILNKDPFELEITKVLELKSLERGVCKLIIKSQDKLMAFKIGLEESNDNPFFYKVLSIDELAYKGEQ